MQLAGERGAELVAVIIEEVSLPKGELTEEVEDALDDIRFRSAQVMEQAAKVAARAGVRMTCEVQQGNPAKLLLERSRQLDCELIVLGHTRRAWGNLLGSTANRVVDHARCDVLIVRMTVPPTQEAPDASPPTQSQAAAPHQREFAFPPTPPHISVNGGSDRDHP